MGCDIRMYYEYKKEPNGKWISGNFYEKTDDGFKMENFYPYRNYALFSVLADVCNNGVYTPICYFKGMPNDLSPEVKEEYESWGDNAHSCSYLTLRELMDGYYNAINNGLNDEFTNDLLSELIQHVEWHRDQIWHTYYGDKHDECVRIVFWFDN